MGQLQASMTVVFAAHSVAAGAAARVVEAGTTATARHTSAPAANDVFGDILPPSVVGFGVTGPDRRHAGRPPRRKTADWSRCVRGGYGSRAAVSRRRERGLRHRRGNLQHREVDAGAVGRVHPVVREPDLAVGLPVGPGEGAGRLVLALEHVVPAVHQAGLAVHVGPVLVLRGEADVVEGEADLVPGLAALLLLAVVG